MHNLIVVAVVACFYLAPSALRAATYDGSVPLICAPNMVMECGDTGECQQRTVKSANLPPFVAVNFEQKTISDTTNSDRTSQIKHMERIGGHLILQGVENGRGWNMVIDEETGSLSASSADQGLGFVIFGACTPYK